MVPGAGLEPARSYLREILSLLRLPISPSGQCIDAMKAIVTLKMEAGVGIEPAYTELQSAA